MYKLIVSILFFFIVFTNVFAAKYTISGYLKDSTNGEELIGATVSIKEKQVGNITNAYGFYSITLDEGTYSVQYSYIGYSNKTVTVVLNKNIRKDIELNTDSKQLQEVVIGATKPDKNVKAVEMSSTKLEIKQIKAIPVLMGEQDIIKTIQLLPGVKSAGEGSGGYYVRGGGTDQNLILLDEAPVYSSSHLGGLFSIFNSDAIKDAKLVKGGMPAEYGGRLSSVMDVKMNDGNSKKFALSGGIGLISSRLTGEGPIVKDRASFLIAGRGSYAHLFLLLSEDTIYNQTSVYFYDINAKVNVKINDNNKIFLSGYFGRDVLKYQKLMAMDWGNTTLTARWNHLFSEKMFMFSSFIFSDYSYEMFGDFGMEFTLESGIRDFNTKVDFQYFLNSNNNLKFGANAIKHTFYPGTVTIQYQNKDLNGNPYTSEIEIAVPTTHAVESGIYAQNEQKISERLSVNYGIRLSAFSNIGPRTVYSDYEQTKPLEALPSDTSYYDNNVHINTYIDWEPRILVNYGLTDVSSIKASVTKNTQYINLLQTSTTGSPIDYWIPCSEVVKPQVALQYAFGYFHNFADNKFETSLEIYYKDLFNQFTFKNGAQVLLNEFIENDITFGIGRSYGAELLLKKVYGQFTGWVSYTYSKTETKFEDKHPEWYPARYDRTHDVSVVGVYQLNEKISFSSSWVYYTGDAITLPDGKYYENGEWHNHYGLPNQHRAPDYHRLDIGMTITNKKENGRESSWNFSIYNVYNQYNAYRLITRENENDPTKTEIVKISLFPILPSVTWNFKF